MKVQVPRGALLLANLPIDHNSGKERVMTMVPPSNVHSIVVNELKDTVSPEAFPDSHLPDLFAGKSEAVVYCAVIVVEMGAATPFMEVAHSVQTMSSDEARQLLDDHHARSNRSDAGTE